MPRRTLASLLALGLAALLATPVGLPAAAQTTTPLLAASIDDSGIALTGPSSAVPVDGPGTYTAEIGVSTDTSKGVSVTAAAVTLEDGSLPSVLVGGALLAVGQSVPIATEVPTTFVADFDVAGRASITLRVTAELAEITSDGVASTTLISETVTVEFDVADPAPPLDATPEESGDGAPNDGAPNDGPVADPVATPIAIGAAPGVAAPASEGPGGAPAPTDIRVISDTHADAVSTFLDGEALNLASKADVAEGNGTRFAAADVWFHVDDDSTLLVPAGFEFIGPSGSTVWLAPETNPGSTQLWPGFSTESVPVGGVDGDRTTFTLTGFSGPGDLELYTGGGTSPITRFWSSDEGIASFTLGRTHTHANWAFTAAGTYRLAVEASATRGGAPVSASAVYTFVVGGMPRATPTSVALDVSDPAPHTGDTVTLTATVTPGDAAGYVVTHYGDEISSVISTTVERWDGAETAERIELFVGRDLQFIRINGTVVGGLAGLVIHAAAQLL